MKGNVRMVQRLGPHSCAVVIPSAIARKLRVDRGSAVVFEVKRGVVTLRKAVVSVRTVRVRSYG